MKFVHYRNLVGVCYTEDEGKALASEIEVQDGPDDNGELAVKPALLCPDGLVNFLYNFQLGLTRSRYSHAYACPISAFFITDVVIAGEMFDRPGKLNDAFPSPYENEEQARSINNGALPPDLSLITKSRHDGQNYLFALLTGYKDPPAGVVVNEEAGQYYNPYFPGGKIGMPKQLIDGAVEFGDGTPSTVSQMAKDVTTFLAWAAEPHQDERKRVGNKIIVALLIAGGITGWYKRFRWSPLKTRKISYKS
jgi:ubiquinol-cytochrome c reductase cytochrome c1 subunit